MSRQSEFPVQDRLRHVVETMREISSQTDAQTMVRAYAARMTQMFPAVKRISVSRRDLSNGQFRITRYSDWKEDINPWTQPEKLPLLKGGMLAELLYGDEPRILNDFRVSESDPAVEYLRDARSVMALPQFDRGTALNMIVSTRTEPHAFDENDLPNMVWMANLFGRAAHTLVLAERLDAAYREVDRELQVVADIQRSLLPKNIPAMTSMRVAQHYETSRRAGGDYFDFFRLPDNCWGILIADVSGHGTPAAVVMAILHSIAHLFPGQPKPPSAMLTHLNRHLTERYTNDSGHFVTAFYAIFDEANRELTYSSAGHNPPRLLRQGQATAESLDQATSFPLGIMPGVAYTDCVVRLNPGDRLTLYTDGITEAADTKGELFGVGRLDAALVGANGDADATLQRILTTLHEFTGDQAAADDRTLLVAEVM